MTPTIRRRRCSSHCDQCCRCGQSSCCPSPQPVRRHGRSRSRVGPEWSGERPKRRRSRRRRERSEVMTSRPRRRDRSVWNGRTAQSGRVNAVGSASAMPRAARLPRRRLRPARGELDVSRPERQRGRRDPAGQLRQWRRGRLLLIGSFPSRAELRCRSVTDGRSRATREQCALGATSEE